MDILARLARDESDAACHGDDPGRPRARPARAGAEERSGHNKCRFIRDAKALRAEQAIQREVFP